jgi:hypothetical protein
MGNLEGDGAVVAQIGGAVDGGHAAAGDRGIDAVGIDLRTGLDAVVEIPMLGTTPNEGVFSTVPGEGLNSARNP